VRDGIITGMALGIYISVPFCRTKCSYCNFASGVFSRALFERYVDKVCADMANAGKTARDIGGKFENAVDSIYLGGGTPTVLETQQLARIFNSVRQKFDVACNAEVTVECAPGTLSSVMLDALVAWGVNRISLGVQSFVDQEAAAVGRLHKRAIVLEDIARLRTAGISNINIDLIAGLPHQTAASWKLSLRETIASEVPHVSVYMLEVDDESRLGRELIAGGSRYHAHFVPDDDATADFYLAACELLASSGIMQYEISNFSRTGFESRHNLKYWTRQPYLGFGVDAHSMVLGGAALQGCGNFQTEEPGFSPRGKELEGDEIEGVRFSTVDSLEKYLAGEPTQTNLITRTTALEENFFLGLRLTRGVDLRQLAATFGDQAVETFRDSITEFVENSLLSRDGHCIRLTSRGRLLSNEVFQRFIGADKTIA
jgi:oxygen-independent coproporphyrinogen III oxidase